MTGSRVCAFTIGEFLFGVEVEAVREVFQSERIARAPLAAEGVLGLINLRGNVVAVLDPRVLLGLPPRAADGDCAHLILDAKTGPVSILVDEVVDVLTVDEGELEPPPATLRGGLRELVRGVHRLPKRLLLLLDAERMVQL